MKTEIYYFSGTGNSLHTAKELQKRIPDSTLIPIIRSLAQDVILPRAESIGIVFPLQGPTFPNAVRFFLEKADLRGVKYIFAVATRGGTSCCIHSEINRLLKKHRKKLNAHFILTMFNNDPKLKDTGHIYDFHIPSPAELEKKNTDLNIRFDQIRDVVIKQETSHQKDTGYFFKYGFILEKIILFIIRTQASKSIRNYFYADSKCSGCGLCEKLCLSDRITLNQNKPTWNDDILCHMCYACLNFCPQKAVQIHSSWIMKSYTAVQDRYPHPYATARDIEEQKPGH